MGAVDREGDEWREVWTKREEWDREGAMEDSEGEGEQKIKTRGTDKKCNKGERGIL